MDNRKRKEIPESVIEDARDRRTKFRETEDEEEPSSETPADTIIADAASTSDGNTATTTAAAASAIDASALPSGTSTSTETAHTSTSNDNDVEPAIGAEKPLVTPTSDEIIALPTMETPDRAATSREEMAIKIPPKPYTPDELARWNQMFFELMVSTVRLPSVLICFLLFDESAFIGLPSSMIADSLNCI